MSEKNSLPTPASDDLGDLFDEVEVLLSSQGLEQGRFDSGPSNSGSAFSALAAIDRERSWELRRQRRERQGKPELFEAELASMEGARKALPLEGLGGGALMGVVAGAVSPELWTTWSPMELLAHLEPGVEAGEERRANFARLNDAFDWLLRWRHEPAARAFGLSDMGSLRIDAGSSWLAIDSHGNLLGLPKAASAVESDGQWARPARVEAARILGALCLGARRAMKIQKPVESEGLKALARAGGRLRQARFLEQQTPAVSTPPKIRRGL